MITWQDQFRAALPRLGHRNWIIVADAAYPQQAGTGVEVVVADVPLDDVLKYVLRAIEESGHVAPKVLLDRELSVLTDDLCPGVSALRASIRFETSPYTVSEADHEVVLEKLNMDTANYTVFVIKTNAQIPYTSVFLQLECGYWDKEREAMLRAKL